MTLHAFDPGRRTNAALIVDALELGYLVNPVLDLTYGLGSFWSDPALDLVDVVANDLDENKGEISRDFRATGLDAGFFGTVVFDPPYAIRGASSKPEFEDRYGLDRYRTKAEIEALIREGTAEAVRLARRFVLVKVQDHVSSGRLQPLTYWATDAALDAGARLVDSMHVLGGRAQPSGRRQIRARHGYSTLLVFET